MNFPTLLESDDLAPGERWVTIRGNAVKINGDGEIVSGPTALKGKDLDGGNSGGKPTAKSLAQTAFKKGWSKKVQAAKAAQFGIDEKEFRDEYRKVAMAANPKGYNAPHTPEQKAAAKAERDKQAADETRGRLAADNERVSADAALRQGLPQKEYDLVHGRNMLGDRSQRQIKSYTAAAVSWQSHDPSKAAVVFTVGSLRAGGADLKEKGQNGSFYGKLPDGRSVRVADHLGHESHDVDLVFDSDNPLTKERAIQYIKDELGSSVRESILHESPTPTLDDLRTASEAKLKRILNGLDKRHRKQLEAAIVEYGGVRNIPEIVWQQIQWEIEDETAAAIVLLMVAADEWTEDELRRQGIAGAELNTQSRITRYVPSAIEQAHTTAAVTTATTRARLERKITDALLDEEMGGTGTLTKPGIRKALDDVFTDSRRETLATDSTTGGFSTGQKGAAERLGGDGASTEAGQKVTIELRWETERDDRVCPRCSPLQDQPEEVWGRVFPNGPGPEAHPNCRCWLRSVAVVEAVTESLRESDDGEGRWVTLDNGAKVKIKDDGTVLAGPPGLEGKNVKDLGKGSDKGEKPAEPQAKSDKPQAKPTDKPRVKQTETPEFKAWFGDSKVVDGEGKPLVVYHGTAAEFNAFDPSKTGSGTSKKFSIAGALYFHSDARFGSKYAAGSVDPVKTRIGAQVKPVFLNIRNPLRYETDGIAADIFLDNNKETIAKELKTGRYDGVVVHRRNPKSPEWNHDAFIALHPSQIKSATGNRGTFDPNSDDIRESLET